MMVSFLLLLKRHTVTLYAVLNTVYYSNYVTVHGVLLYAYNVIYTSIYIV